VTARPAIMPLLLGWLLAVPASAQDEDAALAGSKALGDRLRSTPVESIGFMLNNTERAAIAAALEGVRANDAIEELQEMEATSEPEAQVTLAEPETPNVHLGGLIHVEGGGWSAWINGEPVSADKAELATGGVDFAITGVARDEVELSWTAAGNGSDLRARLKPNQTFIGARAAVTEGRVVASEPPSEGGGLALPFGTLSLDRMIGPFSEPAEQPAPAPAERP